MAAGKRLAGNCRSHFSRVRACVSLNTRNAIMCWEDVLRCLGTRFTRQQWEDRFGHDARTFVRWVRAARRELGLTIRYEWEPLEWSKTTQACVLGPDDVALIRAWADALSDSFEVRRRRRNRQNARIAARTEVA